MLYGMVRSIFGGRKDYTPIRHREKGIFIFGATIISARSIELCPDRIAGPEVEFVFPALRNCVGVPNREPTLRSPIFPDFSGRFRARLESEN